MPSPEADCGDDSVLRREVDRLLAGHARAGGFIEAPAFASVGSWLDGDAQSQASGRRFGAYRVVREIGRGGMGAVYLAERAELSAPLERCLVRLSVENSAHQLERRTLDEPGAHLVHW